MDEWEQELNRYLSNVSSHTRNALYRIKDLFHESNTDFDRKFRKYFLSAAKNRVNEACDRFQMKMSKKRSRDSYSSDDEVSKKRRRKSSSSVSSTVSNGDLAELQMQKELANDVVICGVPFAQSEDLRGMFMRLCQNLNIVISSRDITKIYRKNTSTDELLVVVRFRSRPVRDMVFYNSHTRSIFSSDIIRLRPGERSHRIYITYHVTDHFSGMLSTARRAFKDRVIQRYEINDRGLGIKCLTSTLMKYFVSPNDLEEFIDDLYTSNSVWSKSAS